MMDTVKFTGPSTRLPLRSVVDTCSCKEATGQRLIGDGYAVEERRLGGGQESLARSVEASEGDL